MLHLPCMQFIFLGNSGSSSSSRQCLGIILLLSFSHLHCPCSAPDSTNPKMKWLELGTPENRPFKADECSNCLAIERTSCHYFFHQEMNKHEDYNLCPQQNCLLEEWESSPEVVGCSCKKWDPLIIWHFSPLHNSARGKRVWPQLGTHTLLIQDFLLFTASQIGILPPLKGKQI